MKLFVACLLAVAFNYASSTTPVAPCEKPDYPTIPQVPSTVTINGNVTIQIFNHTQTCSNKENSTASHIPPKLPDGYEDVSNDDGYITGIKLYKTKQNFNEARKTCSHEGAFLAYATTKEENDLYLKKLSDNGIIEIWAGIHDLFTQFEWSTILGENASDVAYIKWQSGQPDNAHGNERCSHNRKEGLNDISCDIEHAFICKIKLPLFL